MNCSDPKGIHKLKETVIDGGYCIGCGVCASLPNSPITMTLNQYGQFEPQIDSTKDIEQLSNNSILSICPFSDESLNEDVIGRSLFKDNCKKHDKIGYYQNTYAGYVKEGFYRDLGSSGGMGTWILVELYQRKLIDKVIHVHSNSEENKSPLLFQFGISESIDDIKKGAKSRYYPVEMSSVIKKIRENPGKYAIVGTPCFIKAIRLLAKVDPIINERITFCIGLVCGHLKSTRFADMFAWQCDVAPGNLREIDFRVKILGEKANKYGVRVSGFTETGEVQIVKQNRDFYGYLWGQGFFKYQACDYCDDVLAETADITIGDAWLPEYINDSNGTNIVVIRSNVLSKIVYEGIQAGVLHLNIVSPDKVAQSQDAGLRHRREGLAYRLYLKDKDTTWRPRKRVKASNNCLDARAKKIQRLRILMAEKSHAFFSLALQKKDFDVFVKCMNPIVEKYNYLYSDHNRKSLILRVLEKLKRFLMSSRR